MRQQLQLFVGGKANPLISRDIQAIVVAAAKRPDPGSVFDLATRDIQHLDTVGFVNALIARQYNAIIALERGAFAGLLGYQQHGDSWHCFVLRVPESIESHGIGTGLVRAFLQMAKDQGMRSVFLWGGNQRRKLDADDEARMQRIYANASQNRLGLPFTVVAGNEQGEILLNLDEHSSVA